MINKTVIKKVLKMERQNKYSKYNNKLMKFKILNKNNKKVIKDEQQIYSKIEKELEMILFIDFFTS